MEVQHKPQLSHSSSGDSDQHVHFVPDQITPDHTGHIVVDVAAGTAEAHLGFLQEHHHYEIELNLPVYLGEEVRVERPSTCLKMLRCSTTKDMRGHDLVLTLFASHDRTLSESIELVGEQQRITLTVVAKALGRGKGTPALKLGIRCTGVEQTDSDMSDYPDHPPLAHMS